MITREIYLKPEDLGAKYPTKIIVENNSFADRQLSEMNNLHLTKNEPTLLRYLTISAKQREMMLHFPKKEEKYAEILFKIKVEYDLIRGVRNCPSHFELLELILRLSDQEKSTPKNNFGIISIERVIESEN